MVTFGAGNKCKHQTTSLVTLLRYQHSTCNLLLSVSDQGVWTSSPVDRVQVGIPGLGLALRRQRELAPVPRESHQSLLDLLLESLALETEVVVIVICN